MNVDLELSVRPFSSSVSVDLEGDPKNLPLVPMMPLYMAIQALPSEKLGHLLPFFSKEQRQFIFDLESWDKDELNLLQAEFLTQAVSLCPDESVQLEFLQSAVFVLLMKFRFTVSTFDLEDPSYPDHEYFFLTEDNLLLIEYAAETASVALEVQSLIKVLYTNWGVEEAYAFLFKIVGEETTFLLEEEYQFKLRRLEEYGIKDYYECLGVVSAYPSHSMLEKLAKEKIIQKQTPRIFTPSSFVLENMANPLAFSAWKNQAQQQAQQGELKENVIELQWEKCSLERKKILLFDFYNVLNCVIQAEGGFRQSSLTYQRLMKQVNFYFTLGISFFEAQFSSLSSTKVAVLEVVSFLDLYKTGKTLVKILQKKLFSWPFAGEYWNFLADHYSLDIPMDSSVPISSYELWKTACHKCDVLLSLKPVIAEIEKTWKEIQDKGEILSAYYENISSLEEVDFEYLWHCLFANFCLGRKDKKLGVTRKELSLLYSSLYLKNEEFQKQMRKFLGIYYKEILENQESVELAQKLILHHFEGWDFESLPLEEIRYVGGILLLSEKNP